MNYRLGKESLFKILSLWDAHIQGRGQIRLIACGGTALTLLGYKESTKDVDFMIPDFKDYERLIAFLIRAGYENVSGSGWVRHGEEVIFDLYSGNKVFTTELLSSPLGRGGNRKIHEWKKLYLGTLNSIDWIIICVGI